MSVHEDPNVDARATGGMSRRDLLRLAGATGVAATAAFTLPGAASASPLAVRRAAVAAAAPSAITVAASANHPLDPLSAAEITKAFQLIENDARFVRKSVYPVIALKEPPKSEVLAWSAGQPFRREVYAQVYDQPTNRLWEVLVDLRTRAVTSWTARTGVQPAFHDALYNEVESIVRADVRWQNAIRARGLRPKDIYLDVWAPGDVSALLSSLGLPPNTRCSRVLSFFQGALPNPYDRPVEGILVTVDINRGVVIDVLDTGVRPVNTTVTGSSSTTRSGLQPLVVTQPNGPSFSLDGMIVSWLGWRFHVGYTPREGLVLSQISYEQTPGAARSIIYRIAQNEIFVPYSIPDPTWLWRSAFDVGEYNMGLLAEPLVAGVDTPANAVFFTISAGSDLGVNGGAFDLTNAIAMWERDGGVLWERTDPTSYAREVRNARELVVMSSYVNGNYSYSTQFVFRIDGSIEVLTTANGTILTQGVASASVAEQYGSAVATNVGAPNHQHFFNFRIDFDVDGTPNRVVEENVVSTAAAGSNAFQVQETVLSTEQYRDLNPASYRSWRVESTTKTNGFGNPTAYSLEPGETTVPYASPSLPALQRAPLAQHPFWVTKYREGELYSSGDFPNQGAPGQGLTAYASGQSLANGDAVVWYSASFTHLTEPENYPVMNAETIGFAIRPSGFFDASPALDAP
jgi:primary-amine oxidase